MRLNIFNMFSYSLICLASFSGLARPVVRWKSSLFFPALRAVCGVFLCYWLFAPLRHTQNYYLLLCTSLGILLLPSFLALRSTAAPEFPNPSFCRLVDSRSSDFRPYHIMIRNCLQSADSCYWDTMRFHYLCCCTLISIDRLPTCMSAYLCPDSKDSLLWSDMF